MFEKLRIVVTIGLILNSLMSAFWKYIDALYSYKGAASLFEFHAIAACTMAWLFVLMCIVAE